MPWRGPGYPGEVPTVGYLALEWITDHLVVPDGMHRGDPLVLTDEQAQLVLRYYALGVDGGRLFRRALISRPKGWGKSPLLAALCAFEALGPAKFDGWDAKGDPVGAPWPTPWVQIAAVSQDQTGNTYSLLMEMLAHGSAAGADLGMTKTHIPGGGKIEPVTSSAGSREGQRVTFAVLDETHLWSPSNGGVALAATIRRNVAKMDGGSFETTNAYVPGLESVAESSADAARAKSPGVLYDHREPTLSPSIGNRADVAKALRYVYGDAREWVDLDRILAELYDPATDESAGRQFYLNQILHSADQAFDPVVWGARADTELVIPEKELITLGFDGARFHDATALVATHVETGHQWPVGIWEHPANVGDEWEVDEADVESAMEQVFDTWEVWRLYGDPPYWETAHDRWAGRWGEKRIIKWWTNRLKEMAYSLRGYRTAMRTGDMSHDGNPLMARHVANARRNVLRMRDDQGQFLWVIRKEHPKSPNKIDAAMAGCLSWEARGDAIAAGALKKKNYRVASF